MPNLDGLDARAVAWRLRRMNFGWQLWSRLVNQDFGLLESLSI